MYQVPTYSQIKSKILTEYLNQTGFVPKNDSDAAIRADGTAVAVEGLYEHQTFIARQLFVATASEPYLYLHADALGLPRLGGSIATGQVLAVGTTGGVTLPTNQTLTDGFGHYWRTTQDVILTAGVGVSVPVVAERQGAAYNQTGTLSWVSPVNGLNPVAQIVTLSGGSNGEELERWRSRLAAKKALGKTLSRYEDLRQAVLGVAGVADCYIYPRRRGAGSVDAAITAQGANGATLPSDALLSQATAALEQAAVFFEDVRAFSPSIRPLNVTATLTGAGINTGEATAIIRDYVTALIPAEPYRESVLTALLKDLDGVIDVQLDPNQNIVPDVSMLGVGWIRAGSITVNLA